MPTSPEQPYRAVTNTTALMARTGMTRFELAEYLGVVPDRVISWHRKSRQREAKINMQKRISEIILKQEAAANALLDALRPFRFAKNKPKEYLIPFPETNEEAMEMDGLPTVSCWRMMIARVIAESPVRIKMIPYADIKE